MNSLIKKGLSWALPRLATASVLGVLSTAALYPFLDKKELARWYPHCDSAAQSTVPAAAVPPPQQIPEIPLFE